MTFTLHTLRPGPHPHTSRDCSGNGIRFAESLCGTNVEMGRCKDTVAAARSCFARTRRGVVLPIFLPRGMHVSSE